LREALLLLALCQLKSAMDAITRLPEILADDVCQRRQRCAHASVFLLRHFVLMLFSRSFNAHERRCRHTTPPVTPPFLPVAAEPLTPPPLDDVYHTR